jgi:hypothetical protein
MLGVGDGTFGAPTTEVVGDRPVALAAGDVDRDGHVDVAVTEATSDTVTILFGAGDGTFVGTTSLAPGNNPGRLSVVDVDGDSFLDVVTSADGKLAVFLGHGDGTFDPVRHFLPPESDLLVADFDGDGRPDVGGRSILINRSRWGQLGASLLGTHGAPLLQGSGTLSANEPLTIALSQARENAIAYITYGLGAVDAPFAGGLLVPDIFTPPGGFVPLLTDGNGELTIDAVWPAGATGLDLYLQYWIEDPAGIAGFSASNAIVGSPP